MPHQRGHFEIFHPFCGKSSKKIEGGALLVKKNLKKKSHKAEKTERGDPLGFFNIRSVGKIEGGPFGENFFSKKKSHRAENTLRKYPFVPLSFLDDVKILLRKLLRQYFKFAK